MEPHNEALGCQDVEQQNTVSAGDLNKEDQEHCECCDNVSFESSDAPAEKLAGFKVINLENGGTH